MNIHRTRKLMIVLSLVVMVLALGACQPIQLPCIEVIFISLPTPGMPITNPVTVKGVAASPFEGQVLVRVWNSSGQQIGSGAGYVTGEMGQCGPFTVSVPFTPPSNSEPGLIQVFTSSPMNGELIHLSSVGVQLQP